MVKSAPIQTIACRVENDLVKCQTQLDEQVPALIRTKGELQDALVSAKSQFEQLVRTHQAHIKALKVQIRFLKEASFPLQKRVSEREATVTSSQQQINDLISPVCIKGAIKQVLIQQRQRGAF